MEPSLPSGATSPSGFGAPGRRRNGRLQACEPCRKRKVCCDHAYPACRRCTARGNADICVYLVPQQTATSSPQPSPKRRVRGDTIRDSASGVHAQGSPTPTSDPSGCSSNINIVSASAGPPRGTSSTETSPGYLGFTSFSAVYEETQNSLSSLAEKPSGISSINLVTSANSRVRAVVNPSITTGTTAALPPRTLETCLIVLQRIPQGNHALSLFLDHGNPNDAWIRLPARFMVESMLASFGRELKEREPDDLVDMAQLISKNSATPWNEHEADAQKWVASYSGRNMRWESLGMLFTYWALGALSRQPRRPEPQENEVQTRQFKEAAELCIELCKGCAPNSLLLFLMYKVAILESMLSGDAAPAFWRLHGEIMAVVTYLGLHAMPHDAAYVPTAASEARRRLVSQTFLFDKAAASFSGRPPLLSRKYMLTPLPLDLSDETLMSDAETIARAVADLDERGWNRDGRVCSATLVRARTMLSRVKDEVMEIALGDAMDASIASLLELKAREENVLSQTPMGLRYSPDDVRDTKVPGRTLYMKILIHLEHLQSLFFISRLLVQRGHDSNADLLSVSLEMVSVTLVFWTHRDRLTGLHGDFEWLVMAFAAPAGGALCNELLKPTLHLTPTPGLTRSGIIQQLSLLIGFLGWVSPSAPNGDLCSSCKAVIQHVLDQSLNAPPVESSSSATDNAFDLNLDLSSDINGYFNFDLLDTFDWLRPDVTSSQQSG